MATLELRPRQLAVVDAVSKAFAADKNILVVAPCGFGKTELATYFAMATKARGKSTSFIMDRISLVEQASERFDKYGLEHSISQAQNPRHRPWEKVHICSLQTVCRKGWLPVSLQIVDECHVLSTAMKARLQERGCYTIGLTATPFTKGLGKYFDCVINAATTNDLIREGLLVPFRVFAASEPDMTGAKVVAGEWAEKDVEARSLPIVGDAVAGYMEHGANKKFIAFASSVAHAEELQKQFLAAGVVSNLYTYRQSDDERAESVAEFRKPDSYIRGLISIESLTRGFDVADVEVLILARPLRKALAVHIQMLGRVLRTAIEAGKTEAIVLDHSGNCMRFWSQVQDFFENGISELDDGKPKEVKAAKKADRKPVKCPSCFHVHDPLPACPACGKVYERGAEIQHVEGVLKEVKGGKAALTTEEKRDFYLQLRAIAVERGYKDGWAANKYKEKFGAWPESTDDAPRPAIAGVLRWVKSRNIAFAKGKQSNG
jgi:superfamily II DNA or RNA helicase